MQPAGFGRRYIAFLLDIFFLEILGTLVTAPMLSLSGHNLAGILVRWGITGRMKPEAALLLAFYALVWVLLLAWYFIGFTAACGQTPGKKIMGLWVVRENGASVHWGTSWIRFMIGYPLSFLPLGLGCYWALADPYHQAWHDKIAGTQVVGAASS